MAVFYFLKSIGLIRINKDINRVPYARAKSLWAEANRRGIDFSEIKPFGLSIDLYQAPIHGKPTIFFNLPRPSNVDESVLGWIDDKWIMKQKLAAAGVPVPKGRSFYSLGPAIDFFQTLGKPVVVKPRTGSRNRHTTVLVQNEEQLARAFFVAKQLCFFVIVEQYLYGDLFRGTTINGKLIGILGMAPAKVTGNGKDPITRLIEIHNQKLPIGMKPISISESNIRHLMLQNLNINSILSKGQTIPLSEKMGVDYSGTSYDCTRQAHLQIKEVLMKATLVVGDPILGFDFITQDVTKPLDQQNFGIIECNGAPFIQLHHDPLIGESINAAKYVWDLVE